MPAIWQIIHSFLSGVPDRSGDAARNLTLMPAPAIVALVASGEEREVLNCVAVPERWDVHYVDSFEDAWSESNRLAAPVILYDRDWPGTEWRAAVQRLAASPHRACVILTSRVADDYLLEELFRQGGYDILVKPLRAEDVARVIKLALSYWRSGARPEPKLSRRNAS